MITLQKVMLSLALLLFTVSAHAGPLTYVIGNNDIEGTSHFGTVDLATGAFQQIGPNTPVGSEGLAAGPGGSLLTLAYNSDLYSINPATGAYTLVGPTGLGDCSTPASPCGPTSNLTLGGANGNIYATDFQNRTYSVNPLTGAATLIGATGIPPIPFIPASSNPDGTINFYEEALFGAGGKLYATFDALVFDLATSSVASVAVAPALYQIDPSTGRATVVGSTDLAIGAVVGANGTNYAFNLLRSQIFSLDVATGSTSLISDTDPTAGTIRGAAAAIPEPASIVLTGVGVAAILVWRRRRRE
jgi:PEP-CTERM motif